MRIGIDYRFLAAGPYQVSRGMGRYTQQQLREVLRVDPSNEYVVCCPAGADTSLIHPDVAAAPNASVVHLPAAVSRRGESADDTLERAELLQAWVERSALDLFHLTTPMLQSEPVLAGFDACPLVVTLYDLIPLVFPGRYFAGQADSDGYMRAVALLARARRLIAISESARDDAFAYLGIPPGRIDVAYPVADPAFRPLGDGAIGARLGRLRASHRIPDRFLLAVTHFHHSKNVEALLRAYALLPAGFRREAPLLLCCQLDQGTTDRLGRMTAGLGIAGDVIVTGMVSDDELAALYGRATVVVHPSRYEGFGLPVVEAMRCGTPVITTTASSLPEVAAGAARLVDPDDIRGMADAIAAVCADTDLRADMSGRGLAAAAAPRFGPEQLAAATLGAYERAAAGPVAAPAGPVAAVARPGAVVGAGRRLRVALWTPVPPQQSGIADYSAELVDELAASCDVELFVDGGFTPDLALAQRHPVHHHSAFERRHRREPFDVTVYQMGNSHFHWYMYDAVRAHPGVVVLHDMAWSQVLYMHRRQRGDLAGFVAELAAAEGPAAASDFAGMDRFTPPVTERARLELLDRHPMLGALIETSLAQVVHFDACRDELVDDHPGATARVVQMGVADPYTSRPDVEVGAARARLRLPPDTFVVGTFGIVHPVKRVESCLRAVARLLASVPDLVLLVVGRMAGPEYEQHLRWVAADLGVTEHVRFTGHVPKSELDAHLMASDVVVNLRTPTHQHMSAIIPRAGAAGKPVVISDIPGWEFMSEPCFVRVRVDDREVDELTEALAGLAADARLRERLGAAARTRFELRGSSRQMAAAYLRVLERVGGRAAC
jgi:glycosyltransferase involved in cell wall biosynthesis